MDDKDKEKENADCAEYAENEVLDKAVRAAKLDCVIALMDTLGIDHFDACKLLHLDEWDIYEAAKEYVFSEVCKNLS